MKGKKIKQKIDKYLNSSRILQQKIKPIKEITLLGSTFFLGLPIVNAATVLVDRSSNPIIINGSNKAIDIYGGNSINLSVNDSYMFLLSNNGANGRNIGNSYLQEIGTTGALAVVSAGKNFYNGKGYITGGGIGNGFDNGINYLGFKWTTTNGTRYGFLKLELVKRPGDNQIKVLGWGYDDAGGAVTATSDLSPSSVEVTVQNIVTPVTENLGTALTYRFSRTGATTDPLDVNFAIAGTASADDFGVIAGTNCVVYDASAKTGTITIPAGASTINLLILPAGDTMIEDDETVIVTVTAAP